MKIAFEKTENIAIKDLNEFQGDLKELSKDNYNRLYKQIKKAFTMPFTVWQDKKGKIHILDGHQRLRVLNEMKGQGEKLPAKFPCNFIKADSEREAKEILMTFASQYGRVTDEGLYQFAIENEFDPEFLKENFNFPGLDLELFCDGYFENNTSGEDTNADDIPNIEEEEPITKLGDLWQLGDHRLLCGDCTIKENVERLMDGQKADIVFTDPPYGMHLNTDWSGAKSKEKFYKEKGCKRQGNKYDKIKGDNDDFEPVLIDAIFNNFSYCKEIFLFGADYYSELLINKNLGSWIVWDKRIEESMDKMFGSCFELIWSKNKHKRVIARIRWVGLYGTEKEIDKDKSRKHPTQKPTELCLWFINRFSDKENLVLDPFLGSGSTLIACEKTSRKCFGMEIDPRYCTVIIRRFEEYTGKKAVLNN